MFNQDIRSKILQNNWDFLKQDLTKVNTVESPNEFERDVIGVSLYFDLHNLAKVFPKGNPFLRFWVKKY